MPRVRLEVTVSLERHLPRPTLRRRIEQTLQDEPAGISTTAMRDALAHRAHALGEQPVGPEQLLRQLGRLLVEGRVDELNGVWTLIDDRAESVDPRTSNQAA
jgi:hypothetical protein